MSIESINTRQIDMVHRLVVIVQPINHPSGMMDLWAEWFTDPEMEAIYGLVMWCSLKKANLWNQAYAHTLNFQFSIKTRFCISVPEGFFFQEIDFLYTY